MLSYCLKCRNNTENINIRVPKTINGKTMVLSKCAICGSKKSKFIKKQEAKRLSSLSATPLNAIIYKAMLSYCLKCKKKIRKTLIREFQNLLMVKQ